MAIWDAKQYLKFADERTQPCRDLIARVPGITVERAVDLGCGPGNSTSVVGARFPGARLVGIDHSLEMLERARNDFPQYEFRPGDISEWSSDGPLDLIFSNAAFQWVPDHRSLLPRLLRQLRSGGVLAVQIPYHLQSPAHQLMREQILSPEWASNYPSTADDFQLLPVGAYYDVLKASSRAVQIWQTSYHHVLENPMEIVEWLKGTALRPWLEPLAPREREVFISQYFERIARAYIPQADGRVIFPFNRLFMVAVTE